jgi:antitoxin component HigA of HigAB toxin-antitoxin module
MPGDRELPRHERPEEVEAESQSAEVSTRLSDLIRKGSRRTASETRLMRLLAVLVEDYDHRHALPPDDSTPGERLRYLLYASGQTATALLPVFGQRGHVHEALAGKRPISARQARELGALFAVGPGLLI